MSIFYHLSAVLANWGGPCGLEVSKCGVHLQEGPEGGSREVEACQSDVGAGEGCGTDRLITWHAQDNQITESQNHRMVGVGRDLCGSSGPSPLPKQGHLE